MASIKKKKKKTLLPNSMEAINSIPLVYLLMLSDGFASFLMEQTVNHKLECILP